MTGTLFKGRNKEDGKLEKRRCNPDESVSCVIGHGIGVGSFEVSLVIFMQPCLCIPGLQTIWQLMSPVQQEMLYSAFRKTDVC